MDGKKIGEKERYKQRLESVGLTPGDDPYLNDNNHRRYVIYGLSVSSTAPALSHNYCYGNSLEPATNLNRTLLEQYSPAMVFDQVDMKCVLLKAKGNPSNALASDQVNEA